jgi:hypothetical protein
MFQNNNNKKKEVGLVGDGSGFSLGITNVIRKRHGLVHYSIEENIICISRMKYTIYLFSLHFRSVDLCVNYMI